MSARKRKKSQASNYIISLARSTEPKNKDHIIGKVKSNIIGTSFSIFERQHSSLGFKECAVVNYEPNILGLKGPRKMNILLPVLIKFNMKRFNKQGTRIDIQGTISERWKLEPKDLVQLNNKPPQWNEQTQSFALNFGGRVTVGWDQIYV